MEPVGLINQAPTKIKRKVPIRVEASSGFLGFKKRRKND